MTWKDLLLHGIVLACILALVYQLVYRRRQRDNYVRFSDPKLQDLRERLTPTFPELRRIDLSGSNKSFTINKEHVFICTKDEKGEYYDDNMLTYVLLHELAHVLCDEVGHTDKYKTIFRALLQRAYEAGLYDPDQRIVDNYCNY